MPVHRIPTYIAAAFLVTAASQSMAADQDTESFAVTTEVKFVTDQRTRGISDSQNEPGVKLTVQAAHQSGLIGQVELSSVGNKSFTNSNGMSVTLAGGYRWGDPDAWHFGVGLAHEMFPDAKFNAPHGLDLGAGGVPTDFRSSTYDTSFAVLEAGYGALETRFLSVISDTYRGADTGGVCGQLLNISQDRPQLQTQAMDCYARGDKNSRGSWLFDVDYKYDISGNTALNLHAGYQKVANFEEGDFSDVGIGVTHKRWGFEWTANWVSTNTRVRELYVFRDGGNLRSTDDAKLVLGVSRRL